MTITQQIDWVLAQFKSMGASKRELRIEFIRLTSDPVYLMECLVELRQEVIS